MRQVSLFRRAERLRGGVAWARWHRGRRSVAEAITGRWCPDIGRANRHLECRRRVSNTQSGSLPHQHRLPCAASRMGATLEPLSVRATDTGHASPRVDTAA